MTNEEIFQFLVREYGVERMRDYAEIAETFFKKRITHPPERDMDDEYDHMYWGLKKDYLNLLTKNNETRSSNKHL